RSNQNRQRAAVGSALTLLGAALQLSPVEPVQFRQQLEHGRCRGREGVGFHRQGPGPLLLAGIIDHIEPRAVRQPRLELSLLLRRPFLFLLPFLLPLKAAPPRGFLNLLLLLLPASRAELAHLLLAPRLAVLVLFVLEQAEVHFMTACRLHLLD